MRVFGLIAVGETKKYSEIVQRVGGKERSLLIKCRIGILKGRSSRRII